MKRPTIPSAGEAAKQMLLSLLKGMQNGMATLENSLQKSTHTLFICKHTHIPYDPAIPLQREMNTYALTRLDANICSSFIHISQNVKEPKYPSSVNKQVVVQPYNGILLSNEKE